MKMTKHYYIDSIYKGIYTPGPKTSFHIKLFYQNTFFHFIDECEIHKKTYIQNVKDYFFKIIKTRKKSRVIVYSEKFFVNV